MLLVPVLGFIWDDMLSEVTLTLVAVYGTFFVAEASDWNSCGEPLVSGVLATVALGVVLAKEGKANMSVEAQVRRVARAKAVNFELALITHTTLLGTHSRVLGNPRVHCEHFSLPAIWGYYRSEDDRFDNFGK